MSGATDFARYSRQVILREVGVHGQALLRDSTALLVGCGGLGCAAAPYLAGAGMGQIILADGDVVDASNLQRQILYRQADLGRPKAEVAATALRALNPQVQVSAEVGRVDAQSLPALLADVDVVLDCSDNFPTRFAVNAACVAARRPLVSGAAIRFDGQLAVFDLRRGGPCYACLYPPAGGEVAETCEEAGVLGPVVGVIGAQQALAALKLLLGLGVEAGTLQIWDARTADWRRLSIARDPACPVCGTPDARSL